MRLIQNMPLLFQINLFSYNTLSCDILRVAGKRYRPARRPCSEAAIFLPHSHLKMIF